jgi:hypothetical protein
MMTIEEAVCKANGYISAVHDRNMVEVRARMIELGLPSSVIEEALARIRADLDAEKAALLDKLRGDIRGSVERGGAGLH